MKLLVQWTNRAPGDWETIDSADWARKVARPVPVGGEVIDNAEGYVYALNVQGVGIRGADHYHVETLPDGCRVTAWADDPDDRTAKENWADVWTFKHLAPDSNFGGAYNTRQTVVSYRAGELYTKGIANGPYDIRTFKPFEEFVPPDHDCIHGIWVDDALATEHDAQRSVRKWRDWVDGVEPECVVDGKVCEQRAIGRYNIPDGTRTFYPLHTTTPSNPHTGDRELGIGQSAPTGPNALSASFTATGTEQWVWSTGALLDANFPSGNYRAQFDVTTADGGTTYGVKTISSVVGHFARLDSFPSYADAETWTDGTTASGTGLKMFTTGTINPAAGATTDLWEVVLVIDYDGTGHGMGPWLVTIDLNQTDTFVDGPWTPLVDTYTVAVSVDLHVAQRLTVAVDADILVAERKSVAVDVDIIVEDGPSTITVPVDVDLLVAERKEVTVDVDAHVAQRLTVPVDVDVLVGGSVVPVDVDVLVAQRLTVPVDVDLHVAERKTVTVAVDLIVEDASSSITVPVDVDILVAQRLTVAVAVDLLAAQRLTVPVDVDLLVGGSTVPVAVDLHVAERKTVPVDVDLLAAQRLAVPVDVDLTVAEQKTVPVDVDLIVENETGTITVPVDVDLHVAERKTVTVGVDIWVVGITETVDVDLAVQPQDVFMVDTQVDNGHNGPVGAPTKVEALDDFVGSPDSADYIWWQKSGTLQTKLDTFRIWAPKDVHKTGSPKSIKVVWSQIKFSANTFIARSALHHGNPTSDPRKFHDDSWIHATNGVWNEEVQEWPLMPAGWYGNSVRRAWTWEKIEDLFIGINSGSADDTEGRHRYLHAIIETLPYWVVDVLVDLHVAERKSVTVDVDLLVAEQKTVPVDVDVVVAQRLAVPVDVDLHVIGNGVVPVDVDVIVAQRLAETVDVDIIVSEAGLFVGTVPVDVDVLVAERKTLPVDVDLHIAERKLATVDVDVQVITRATVPVAVDIQVGERKTTSVDVDIFVKDAHDLRPLADFETALSVQGFAEHYKAVGGATIPGTDDLTYVFVRAGSPGAVLLDNLGAEGAIDAIRIGTITAIVIHSRALAIDSNPAQSVTQFIITMQFNGVPYNGASHDPSLPAPGNWWDYTDRLEKETAVAGPNNYFQWDDIPDKSSRWARALITASGGFSPPTESEVRISEVYFHLETYREWYMREVYNFGEFPIDSPEGAGVGVVHANVDIWVHGNGKTTVGVDIWVIDPNAVSVDLELRSQVDVGLALRSQVDVDLDLRNVVDVDFEMESKQSESVVLKSQTNLEVDLKGVYE